MIGKPIKVVKNPQASREEVTSISWTFPKQLVHAARSFIWIRHKSRLAEFASAYVGYLVLGSLCASSILYELDLCFL